MVLIVLGADKSSQGRDIARAKAIWRGRIVMVTKKHRKMRAVEVDETLQEALEVRDGIPLAGEGSGGGNGGGRDGVNRS